jgi:hypothetical protein
MLRRYGVFVQSQVGYQPVLLLLLLQLQGGKLQLKLLGTPLSMCSCSRCCSFYVFSLYVLLFWALLTICDVALTAPPYVTSCSWRSLLCVVLLWTSLLCVLLLWTFLTLCALAMGIPHFVNSCSQHSSLYVFLLLAFLVTFKVVGGNCCC